MELMTVAVGGFLATKQDENHGWTKQDENHGWSYLGW
jgi:hypothetical protein